MSAKRLRESSLTSEDSIPKTPRSSSVNSCNRVSVLNLIEKRLEDHFESMKTFMEVRVNDFFEKMKAFITERENLLLNKINKITDELKREVSCVNERVNTVADEIIDIRAQLQELKLQTLKQENLFVACDLRINGVPYYENENLYNIFDTICEVINIPTPSVKAIYRLKNKNNKNKENSLDAVIIVNLMSPYDKNFVLKSLAIFKKNKNTSNNNNQNYIQLLLNDIGMGSDKPFYVNESLTAKNYKIFKDAQKLKKGRHIHSVYTFRGLVYVKRGGTDQPIRIDDIEQLRDFLPTSNSNDAFQPNNDVI